MSYKAHHERSIKDPDGFWGEQAKLIHWEKPFDKVLNYNNPPFAKWFEGGLTNLCYNAVDRHYKSNPDQLALVAVSTETNQEKAYTFKELYEEVNRMAAIYKANGIQKGDRVLIYMPMIAEACFAMLACARIGAIHSVVFGGFASHSLATRIDDAKPKMVVTAEAGMRGGKAVPYKPLLDEAITLATYKPEKVLIVNRGLSEFTTIAGRDLDYATERQKHLNDLVPVEWVDATHPSYILYTSGTTGKPKGVSHTHRNFIQAGQTVPSQTAYGAGEEGPTMTITPEQKPDYAKQLAIALNSQSPTVRALGTEMLKQSITPQKVGADESLVVRDIFGGGGYTPIAKGAEKLPTEYKEYQKAVEGGFKGSFFDYQQALKRAGAPSVSVNTAKDISAQVGDIAKESRVQAAGAVQTADAANRIIQAVDSKNLISGPGANVRLQAAQIADAIGAGGNTTADKIANSRQAVQGLAQLTLQGRKQMRGEGAITESEGKLAERAMSGDLNFTAAEIRQLAEAAKRSAKFTYNQHQNIINTMQNNPDAKGLVPYFQVPADADIFNPRPVGGQSATRTKADQILQGKP